jgi:hypothetical protein
MMHAFVSRHLEACALYRGLDPSRVAFDVSEVAV